MFLLFACLGGTPLDFRRGQLFLQLRNLLLRRSNGRTSFSDWVRRYYDKNAQGEAAPYVDYVSRVDVRRLFKAYRTVRIENQNFDSLRYKGKTLVPRELLLNNLGRVLGVDLYVTATK